MTTAEPNPEDQVIIDLREKTPTQARQAGMIAHERGLVRYRGPETHLHGTVYRVNVPTFLAVLIDLLSTVEMPALTHVDIVAAAVERYGPDTNVEAFVPEQGMLVAMWALGLHRYGAKGDEFLHFRDGMLDTSVSTTATATAGDVD